MRLINLRLAEGGFRIDYLSSLRTKRRFIETLTSLPCAMAKNRVSSPPEESALRVEAPKEVPPPVPCPPPIRGPLPSIYVAPFTKLVIVRRASSWMPPVVVAAFSNAYSTKPALFEMTEISLNETLIAPADNRTRPKNREWKDSVTFSSVRWGDERMLPQLFARISHCRFCSLHSSVVRQADCTLCLV